MLPIHRSPRRSGIIASLCFVSCWVAIGAEPAKATICTAPPQRPTGLAASGTVGFGTFMHWAPVPAPANCTISGYTVLMNGSVIGTTPDTTFPVTGLAPSTSYEFEVVAIDSEGPSARSVALQVITRAQNAGTAYYVSKAGDNANSGLSRNSAWRTIAYAASQVTAGDTVYVGEGIYRESVPVTQSGTATAPIIFDGQGVAIVDGTGVACCTSPPFVSHNAFVGATTQGLFSLGHADGLNYVTVEAFTIRNYKTASTAKVPVGVLIVGGGTGINVLDNTVEKIQSTARQTVEEGPNAYGIGVFGTAMLPLSVNVSYNTVTGCLTGESETTTFNGNVQNFTVSYNTIHGNDNIGMDAIGFEGIGPAGYDQAKNGDVFGNVIYENSAINNPGEQGGGQDGGYDEDGLYCDGCTQVVFERNLVYANDINIEAASENAHEVSSDVIIRNNVTYGANSAGITVGGYQQFGVGGSTHITIVNNSLYNDDLQNTGSGEFQIQWRATGIVFENNIVYPGSQVLFLNGYVPGSEVVLNHNDYYTTSGTATFELNGISYPGFSAYRSATGQDEDSVFADPRFESLPVCNPAGTTPSGGYSAMQASTCGRHGLGIGPGSVAVNAGNNALGSPAGSGYSAYQQSELFVGSLDFTGNDRVNSDGLINIGAYER